MNKSLPVKQPARAKRPSDEEMYSDTEKELMAFQQTYNSTPDVVAFKAFHRLMGENIEGQSDDNDYNDPYEDGSFLESVGSDLDNALANGASEDIRSAKIELAKAELAKAKEYIRNRNATALEFYNEIAQVRSGRTQKHLLCITQDDPSKPITQVRLSKISVAKWARPHVGRTIPDWENKISRQPGRTHTTPLLEVLDALIAAHWEGLAPGTAKPKKLMIEAWLRENYLEMINDKILSQKVIDAMFTIINPEDRI